MPIIPKFLQKTMDPIVLPIMKKIVRSGPYVRRYNNSLDFRVNEAYLRYGRSCNAQYIARHPDATFNESRLRTHTAQFFPHLLSPEQAHAYTEKMSHLIDTNTDVEEEDAKHKSLLKNIRHPARALGTDYLQILRDPGLHTALVDFFRSDFRLEWVTAFRTMPSNVIASSWNWHTDANPPFSCKIFIHLTPVTAATGATEFMTPADTELYRKAGYFGDQYGYERMGDDDIRAFAAKHSIPYRPFHFDAQPGDVMLFNQNFLHRAVAPSEGHRDVIALFLLSNDIPWDEQLKKDGIDYLKFRYPYYPKNPRRV